MAQPDFNHLSEAEQREVAERLLKIKESGWKPFWCPNPQCSGDPHPDLDINGDEQYVDARLARGPKGQPLSEDIYDWPENPDGANEVRLVLDPTWAHNHARADQRLLPWKKMWTLFIMSGRGSGKTRTGIEFVTLCARKGLTGAILGRRGTELVNTHVAEILAHAHPEFTPIHWASKDLLEWPNGAITYLFSAEKPENIRSVNLSYAWVDEAAFMDEIRTAWMNLKLATRVKSPGNPIHFLITSTPTGTPWVMEMEDDPDVVVRRVSTYANRANLDKEFLETLRKEYEGTRIGRQELHGEVLRDVEGALWNDDMFDHIHLDPDEYDALLDYLDDRVVAVDPAGTANKRSDSTGIIAAGVLHGDNGVSKFDVLARGTLKGSPDEWAERVFKVARHVRANRIVVEKTYGGDMVKKVLTDWAQLHPTESQDDEGNEFRIVVKDAVKSKETRAEPVVGKYEQGRVRHVTSNGSFGDLSELEKQQVTWVPRSRGGRSPSPNDIDALVWAISDLDTAQRFAAVSATSKDIAKLLKKRSA